MPRQEWGSWTLLGRWPCGIWPRIWYDFWEAVDIAVLGGGLLGVCGFNRPLAVALTRCGCVLGGGRFRGSEMDFSLVGRALLVGSSVKIDVWFVLIDFIVVRLHEDITLTIKIPAPAIFKARRVHEGSFLVIARGRRFLGTFATVFAGIVTEATLGRCIPLKQPRWRGKSS